MARDIYSGPPDYRDGQVDHLLKIAYWIWKWMTGGVTPAVSGGGGGGDATAANQATQITAEQAIQAAVKPAANLATAQVTSTGSAATLAIARPTRKSVLVVNNDAANSVWVGPATVTTGNGVQIKPGQGCSFTFVGLLQVIDNGSHAVVSVADEYQ